MKPYFIIQCKRVAKRISGGLLPLEKQEWVTLCTDRSSGCLCFCNTMTDLCMFNSEKEAKEFWDKYVKDYSYIMDNFKYGIYNKGSLAIYKVKTEFTGRLSVVTL